MSTTAAAEEKKRSRADEQYECDATDDGTCYRSG